MRRLGLVLILVLFVTRTSSAQELSEYSVKAAFLLNFLKFTELNLPEQAPIETCILGSDTVYQSFLTLDRKIAQRRTISIRRGESGARLQSCNVVYLAASGALGSAEVLKVLAGGSALTVGEGEDFLEQGGMIKMIVDQGKVRFAIAPAHVQKAGLSLSSKLLALAEIWKD